MMYALYDETPLGKILLSADEIGLTGLSFAIEAPLVSAEADDLPAIADAKRWLELYFSGIVPDFCPPLHLQGSPFALSVWNRLALIPYGCVTTYGELAKQIAAERGIPKMSAQAVGSAIGRNPIAIILPCHRVLAAGGKPGGYAGGLDRKMALLALEGCLDK